MLLDDFWLAFTPEATSESSADGNSSGANAGGTAGPGAPITPTSGIAPTKALSFSPSGASNGPAAHGQVQPLRFERSQPAAPTAGEPLMTMSSTLPEVTIEAIDWTASESGESTGAFRVSRTGDTGAALTVYYEVSGTADEDDYHETLADPNTGIGSVTIPAGAYSAAIKVTPVADETPEDWEYVEVSLTFSGGGSGGGDPTYTIGDPWFDYVDIADESYDGTSGGGPGVPGDPVVWIGAVDPNASEFGTSTAAYKVSRDGSDFSSPLEVEVYVGGQAMAGGIDYSGLAEAWQTVTIPSGETSVTLKVTPVDDTGTTGDNGEFDEPVRMLLPDPAAGAGYTIDSSYFVNLDIRDAKPDYRIVPGPHPRKLKTQVVNNRHVPIYQVAGNGNGTASVVNYGEGALNDDNNTGVPLKVNWVSMDMSFTKAGPIDTTFEALPTNGTTEFRFEVVVINLTGQFQDSLFFELGFLVDGQFIPVNDNTGLDFDTPHKDPTPEDSNKKFA
ncbi:MAG TPA: hypothetical protein VIL46_04905, partial [Gemmataceae bacterium]